MVFATVLTALDAVFATVFAAFDAELAIRLVLTFTVVPPQAAKIKPATTIDEASRNIRFIMSSGLFSLELSPIGTKRMLVGLH
jgi:hypothetical protein